MQQAIIEMSAETQVLASVLFILCCAVVSIVYFKYQDKAEEADELSKKARTLSGTSGYTARDMFRLEGKEWSATGYGTVSGFVVEKGSIVRKEAFSSLTDKLHNLRQSFMDNGILVNEVDGTELVLRTDFEFDSSTAAASFVTGRKASGPYNWKDSEGMTFGEYTNQNIPGA